MTKSELYERWQSDTRAAHEAFERGFVDAFALDNWIEKIDNKLLGDYEFCKIAESIESVELSNHVLIGTRDA